MDAIITLENLAGYEPHIIIFLLAFFTTFIYTPKLMQKTIQKGLTVRDMYKRDKPMVPNLGGLAILVGIISSLLAAQFLVDDTIRHNIFIFYFLVMVFALFGLADDVLGMGRKFKIYIPFFLALPISVLLQTTSLHAGQIEMELGPIYLYLVAPIYVMVVANLVNMHSGFNGLSCGLSYIVLVFIVIKSLLDGQIDSIIYILPMLGATLAFLYYETYPARIFWGNIGSHMVGAGVGAFIVFANLEIFGMVVLIPHIINFLMYVVWKIKKIGEVKFGKLREDGTLEVPNPLTLKWLFPYYFHLTEHQSMWIMYSLTTLFGIIALVFVP